MTSRTLLTLAVAGVCALSPGAYAGGTHHGDDQRSATSAVHGARDAPGAAVETTEYWLIGSEPSGRGVGASASEGGSGSVGVDSSTSGSADRAVDDSPEIGPARRSEAHR